MIRKSALFGGILLLSLAAVAATLASVTMPDTMDIDGQKLVLNGMALRKKVIFKVYVDGLYLPRKEAGGEKILQADGLRVNVMHFLRKVEASKINEAWLDGLKANTPNPTPELKTQFDTLCFWMEEMRDGDKLMFTYRPGKGTEVNVKGKVKGTLEGKTFSDALFACWIGPKPGPGESFKKGLLGI
jgi:hypothetical protein